MRKQTATDKKYPTSGEATPDAGDVAAALADSRRENIGFLPGSAAEKMQAFNGIVEAKRRERVLRDSMAGVTSHPVIPMRRLRLRSGGMA